MVVYYKSNIICLVWNYDFENMIFKNVFQSERSEWIIHIKWSCLQLFVNSLFFLLFWHIMNFVVFECSKLWSSEQEVFGQSTCKYDFFFNSVHFKTFTF